MNVVCRVCRTWILRQRLERMQSRVYQVAYAWSHDQVLARELAVNALRHVARDPRLFNKGAELRIRLYQRMAEAHRRYQARYRDLLRFVRTESSTHYRPTGLIGRVRRALARLPDEQRKAVALVDIGGCSYEEVTGILGIPRERLVTALCQARVEMKTALLTSTASATWTGHLRSVP